MLNFFKKNSETQIFIATLFWIQHEKYIQMSTNKPSIGSADFEIASVSLKQKCILSTFVD